MLLYAFDIYGTMLPAPTDTGPSTRSEGELLLLQLWEIDAPVVNEDRFTIISDGYPLATGSARFYNRNYTPYDNIYDLEIIDYPVENSYFRSLWNQITLLFL